MKKELEQGLDHDHVASPDDLFAVFDKLHIDYELYHHPAVFSVKESAKLDLDIPGAGCRNLFLRDKKKRNVLVTALNDTPVDLKALEKATDFGRFSFGSQDRLWEFLGVKPGSVCPFCVINDKDHQVCVILDKDMMEQKKVNYHPLQNTMTVCLTPQDLIVFLNYTGHKPIILDLHNISAT